MDYFIYILTNKYNKVIYAGITNNIKRRIFEYKNKLVRGFTSKDNLTKLVYFEKTTDVRSAIKREKQIKMVSKKKIELIESENPSWNDLISDWYE